MKASHSYVGQGDQSFGSGVGSIFCIRIYMRERDLSMETLELLTPHSWSYSSETNTVSCCPTCRLVFLQILRTLTGAHSATCHRCVADRWMCPHNPHWFTTFLSLLPQGRLSCIIMDIRRCLGSQSGLKRNTRKDLPSSTRLDPCR